jgi:hypothetical protein
VKEISRGLRRFGSRWVAANKVVLLFSDTAWLVSHKSTSQTDGTTQFQVGMSEKSGF